MRHRLFVHIVWTTLDRGPLIDSSRAGFLDEHLRIIARQERASVVALGIVATHVHLLARLHPTTSITRLVQRLKGTTSHGLRANVASTGIALRWAKGYSVQSVSERAVLDVVAYVAHQGARHPEEAIAGRCRSA